MKNIEQYIQRFNSLLESTIGDVKPLINESSDLSDFYVKKSSPGNYLVYVSKKEYNWEEAKKVIIGVESYYVVPIDFEKIKNTFNSGTFWNGHEPEITKESDTKKACVYDFKSKKILNKNKSDKNKIILRKRWS